MKRTWRWSEGLQSATPTVWPGSETEGTAAAGWEQDQSELGGEGSQPVRTHHQTHLGLTRT